MKRYNYLIGLIVIMLLTMSACGALKPLYTEAEVLSVLSERYGKDFMIVETTKDCDYGTKDQTIRCQLYQAAPVDEPMRTFWVHSEVGSYWGGDSLPRRYRQSLTDTFAFDYFLERFDTLLSENDIDHLFRAGFTASDVTEHLASQHLQGGEFVIRLSPETAAEVVNDVFTLLDQIAAEQPFAHYLDHLAYPSYTVIRLNITFCDEKTLITDGDSLAQCPYFSPYDRTYDDDHQMIYRDNAQTMLQSVYQKLYPHMLKEGATEDV